MKVRTVVLVALALSVSVTAGADRTRGLGARIRDIFDTSRRARGAAASARSQVFTQVDVANAAGVTVATMVSDDVNAGAAGVFDSGGSVSAVMVVDDDGSGVFAAYNTIGSGGYALHGTLGMIGFGGDVAEVFPAGRAEVAKGSVMSLDPEHPGSLRLTSQAYDRKVAGVVAGANDYRSAVTLRGSADIPGGIAVTLTGTVYCLASNANGEVRVGDLLTSSAQPGYAMRATDREASRGAILGKAMENLKGERGLVLMLTSLQ